MNKKVKFVSVCLLGLVTFTACKKEVSSSAVISSSSNSAGILDEQSKKDIEKTANLMIDKLEGVDKLESVGASINLLSLLNSDNSSDDNTVNNPAFMPIAVLNAVADFGKTGSTTTVEKTLKGGNTDNSMDDFNEVKGEYVWNGKEFIKSSSDKIIIRFPSREGGPNDAIYSIAYEENKSNTILPEGLLTPSLIDAKLTVSGKVLIQFVFKSTFDNQGMPTFVQSKLILTPFSFENTMIANSSQISQEFSFRKSGEVLIGMGMGMKGTFSSSDVKALLASNENDEELDPKALKSFNMHVQLLDLIIKSDLDVAGALQVSDLGDLQDNMNQLNSFYNAGLYYVSNGRKIADLQLYSKAGNNESGAGLEDSEMSIRLVFADKSKVDLATYLEGFDDLTKEIEDKLAKALGEDENK
jgi:hypothetical protein